MHDVITKCRFRGNDLAILLLDLALALALLLLLGRSNLPGSPLDPVVPMRDWGHRGGWGQQVLLVPREGRLLGRGVELWARDRCHAEVIVGCLVGSLVGSPLVVR